MRTKSVLLGALLATLAPTAEVSLAQPEPLTTVTLQSGSINGRPISSTNNEVRVFPGDLLMGAFTVEVHNGMHPGVPAPVAATLTWGEPSTNWWPIADVKGLVDTFQTVDLPSGLKAPTGEGTYYIVVAMAGYCGPEELVSLSQPCEGSTAWGDLDLATLPSEVFELAAGQGWGSTFTTPPEIGMTCVKVVVSPLNTVSLGSGSINRQTISPGRRTVWVAPGGDLSGAFTVQVHNGMHLGAFAPVVATPTWGESSTGWWAVARVDGLADTVQTVELPAGLQAPAAEGIYYIAVAMAGYCEDEELLSLARPCHDPEWGDPDLATLPAQIFETAVSQGWAATPATPPEIGMASIKVVVGWPVIEAHKASGDQLVVEWNGKGTLQWAPTPEGPWTDLSGSESVTIQIDLTANRFFRVIRR